MQILKALPLVLVTLVASTTVSAQVTTSPTKDVSVNATLTSACVFVDAVALTLNATYPAFSGSDVAPQGAVNVQCTRGVGTPVVKFAGTAGPVTDVVGGLVFELTAVWAGGATGTAPVGAAIGDLGSPDLGAFTVKARFPAGQAGTTGATTAVVKQMTIQF